MAIHHSIKAESMAIKTRRLLSTERTLACSFHCGLAYGTFEPFTRGRSSRPCGLRTVVRQHTFHCGRKERSSQLSRHIFSNKVLQPRCATYLIFHPSSSWSSLWASDPLIPTTTSDLIVRSEQTGGVPGSEARGPIATSKGVVGGAWQSYVSFRWLRSPLKTTRSEAASWKCTRIHIISICRISQKDRYLTYVKEEIRAADAHHTGKKGQNDIAIS